MTTNKEMVLIAIIAFLLGVIACHTATRQIKPAEAQTAAVAGQKFQQRCEYINKSPAYKENEQALNEYLNLKAQSGWKLSSFVWGPTEGGYTPYFCFVKEL